MQSVYVKFRVTIHTAMLALKAIVQPNDQITSMQLKYKMCMQISGLQPTGHCTQNIVQCYVPQHGVYLRRKRR